MTTSLRRLTGPALCGGLLVVAACTQPENSPEAATAGPDGFIAGGVQSAQGPEAGVWVIAETKDLPTKFVKIVVTDDEGRFMLPELPDASYDVWVRGYGLVDSAPLEMRPTADPVTLQATAATTPEEAARVYPGDYWLSLMAPPDESLFPGTGDDGNGMGTRMLSQAHWLDSLKSDCNFCHQLGSRQTRTVDHVFEAKPELTTHKEAWEWRLGTGVRGNQMYSVLRLQGMEASLDVYADWTERIAAGELPPAPTRPQGIERNLVLTLWDVGSDKTFMHDLVSTDKNNPGVNAGGPVYAASSGHGQLVVLDPVLNVSYARNIPTRDPRNEVPSRFPPPMRPSFFWGDEHIWANPPYNPSDPHNPMIDSKGRVWLTSKLHGARRPPAWCSDPENKYAAWWTPRPGGRHASFFDPVTQKFTLIETCFSTHHLQFDNDPNETVYFNGGGAGLSWVDTKVFDETGDEQQAVGWCPLVVDTNGDGVITKPWNVAVASAGGFTYRVDAVRAQEERAAAGETETTPAPDPRYDTQLSYGLYSVIPSPVDDSVWGASQTYPGYIIRLMRGEDAPTSCRSQIFRVPEPGFDPRGIDIASDGVVWTALAGSSHLASLDVRKCEPRDEPDSPDGSQCPEGWSLYRTEGPTMKGTDVPADFHYYNWVDQHDIAGLGQNTPIATGSNSDSLLALDPETGEWTTLRVPYPLGFFSRGLDGRIDDPDAGWKGRALWANYGTNYIWHTEGGKGTRGKFVKFQVRPDPLAR